MAEKAEIVISAKDQTGGAFASATRTIHSASTSLSALAVRAAGIAGAITAAAETFERFNPKPIIDQADALGKLSQRTGVAVETLSSYQYAAKLADVSNEELDASLKKLNLNIAAAARGETEQAGAFRAIGISVTDASGKVRSADKVFEDIADRFAGYNDGANKVAIANAVGGKSFEKLIPLLNDGKEGLQKAREELERFGGVLTGEFAQKAQQFNDNMTRLAVAGEKLKITIATGLIDSLVKYSEQAVEAARTTGLFAFALEKVGELFSGKLTSQLSGKFLFFDALPEDRLKAAQKNVDDLSASIVRLQDYLARNPGSSGTIAQLDQLQEKLKAAQVDVKEAATRSFRVSEAKGADFSPAPRVKTEAAALPGTGAADKAQALLRKQLDGRIKEIQSALEREQDLFRFSDSKLQELYDHGELSIDAFYDAKAKSQLDSLAQQQTLFDEEIKVRREFERKFTTATDKEEQSNKVAEVLQRQSKAYREAGQAAEVAEQQRVRATESFQKALAELDAQLKDMSGDQLGADLIRNAERLRDIEKTLGPGGGDSARVQRARELLDVQAKLADQQRQYGLITAQAANAEERLLLRAEQGGKSRDEIEKELFATRTKSLQQLDALIAKQEILVQQAGGQNKEAIQQLDDLRLAREKAFANIDPGLTRFNEQILSVSDTLAGSIEDAIIDGSSAGFKNLEKQLVRMVINDQVTKPLADAFNKTLKDLGSGGEGGGFAKLFTGIGGAIGRFLGIGGDSKAAPGESAGMPAGFKALSDAAAKGAEAFGASTDAMVKSTDNAAAAFGGLPAVLSQFATYIGSLFSSSSSGGGGGLGGLFGSLFGSGSGSSAAGTAASDEALALFFHNGGIVGAGGTLRSISRLAFAGDVPRYHGGGIAGLKPDERPAILRKGEEVIREDDPRHRRNAGSSRESMPPLIVNFTVGDNVGRATQDQIGKRVYEGARRAWLRDS